MPKNIRYSAGIKPPFWSSLAICLFLLVGGLFLEKIQFENARANSLEHLQMIAKVKADQLDRWLDERKGDALVLSSGSSVFTSNTWIGKNTAIKPPVSAFSAAWKPI